MFTRRRYNIRHAIESTIQQLNLATKTLVGSTWGADMCSFVSWIEKRKHRQRHYSENAIAQSGHKDTHTKPVDSYPNIMAARVQSYSQANSAFHPSGVGK